MKNAPRACPHHLCLTILMLLALSRATGADPITARDRIDEVLFLDHKNLIVVVNPQDEIAAEIDRLSSGEFGQARAAWMRSQQGGGKPNWVAYHTVNQTRHRHIAEARTNIREARFQLPETFALASPRANAYLQPVAPAKVTVHPVGLGSDALLSGNQVNFVLYCYLELATPLTDGETYTITVSGDRTVTFDYNESEIVSRAIKVNQLGYLTDAPRKFAYFGAYRYGLGELDGSAHKNFEVRDAQSNSVVYRGAVQLRDKKRAYGSDAIYKPDGADHWFTGEDVYELDLQGLDHQGLCYIYMPGVGRSWTFRVGDDVYGEGFYTSARALYHQRCNISLGPPYTNWPRQHCHQDPIYECEHIGFGLGKFGRNREYKVFDVVAGSLDTTRKTEHVVGGWHDAADWDRNTRHYTNLFDLLYLYELMPGKFTDNQLNIPESGNGIPDILDEADFGIEVWTRSMNADGGVSGFVETWTHPDIDADVQYAYALRTRWNSLDYAAAAAMLAQHLEPFDAEKAARYRENALKAWRFGANPKNSLGKIDLHAKEKRGQGDAYIESWEEREEFNVPYLIHARLRMYLLTGDKEYVAEIPALLKEAPKLYVFPLTHQDYSPWFYFSLAQHGKEFLPKFSHAQIVRDTFIQPADELVSWLDQMPYRRTWEPRNNAYFGFGNSDVTNRNRTLLAAFALTRDDKYRDAAILNTDFMFGANPLGMSWTTGIGSAYPIPVQHWVSEHDGIDDPVPGITIFGITPGNYYQLKNEVWKSPLDFKSKETKTFYEPKIPLWRNWSAHPTLNVGQCEFTIYETVSSTILSTAWLMNDAWKPDDALKNRQPKPKSELFGYYYLP